MKEKMETPFSSGSQAMGWVGDNCDRCTKAYKPKEPGEWPCFKTMQQYCSIGKECRLKLAIDIGFVTSEVPSKIIDQIGRDENGFIADQCMLYSDNEDDGYKPKPRPKPDNVPGNQMTMPFIIEGILNRKELTT